MGLFSGKKKTYVSSTITNLYTQDAEEIKMANMAILEATVSDVNIAPHIASTQLGANGVKYRNYCYWAKQYKFKDLHNEDIGEDDRTWAQMINYYEPQVSASPSINLEDMSSLLARDYNFNPNEKESTESREVQVKNKETGIISTKTISVKLISKEKFKIVNSYCGKYFYTPFGEAYMWSKQEYFDKYSACIYTGETTYNISLGYGMQEEDGSQGAGTENDIYIQFGYTVEEEISLIEGQEPTKENTFYETESILVPIKQELNINDSLKYLCISVYIYTEILEEEYEKDGEYYLVDSQNNLIPTGNYINKEFEYLYEYEDKDGTVSKTYTSTIDIEKVRPVGIIKSEIEIKNDSILSKIYEDPGNVSINFAPPICLKNDKRWIDLNNNSYWFYRNKAVCRKIYSSFTYYQELLDNLYEPCSNGDIGWVYLVYGLPTNMVQLDYCARYALQFFKQLVIPDWESISGGIEYSRDIGGRSWQYGSHAFNMHFNFSVGGISYRAGFGKCPVKPECKRGECGFSWFYGQATLWRQYDTEAWEYLIIRGYSTTFVGIKNGKNGPIGSNGWTDSIWKNESTKERNYSKAIIPISAEIAKHIPLTNWTDLTQYIGNIGVTSYKVVKIKWYQTGIFKVIVIVISIVVTIIISIFMPTALPATMLTFGSIVGAGAVLLNLLVAAAVSFAAAVICNSILKPILVDIFGDFWGSFLNSLAIIGLSMWCCNVDILSPSSWTSPDTLLSIWDAYTNASAERIAGKFEDLQKEKDSVLESYNNKQDELDALKEMSGVASFGSMNYMALAVIKDVDTKLNMDMSEAPINWLENFTEITINDEVPKLLS